MPRSLSTIVYPATDLPAATALFTALTGTEPYVNEPYYVGFRAGDVEIGLDPRGQVGSGPIGYWDVDDIAATSAELTAAGATTQHQPHDVGGGLLVATLTDVAGNVVGLRQLPAGA
ncbi:MAG: VOC family protein [Propionibacteriaceae bacterium]